MVKLLKILARTIGISIEWILILVIFFAFAIRNTNFQTFLAHKATNYLSKELNTTLKIGKVDIIFFDQVALHDIFVLDQQQDTLGSFETIYVSLDDFLIPKNTLIVEEVQIEKGTVHVSRDAKNGDYNYEFIVDFFDSGKKTKKKSKDPIILVKELDLRDINVNYSDNRKGHNVYGMDYDYLSFKHINLFAQNININNGVFIADIRSLTVKEKCGIELTQFSTHAIVSDAGLDLKNLYFKTGNGSIVSLPKFKLLMHSLADFHDFEDQVKFDANLAQSKVNLKDISYFAPILKGLSDDVIIQANVTEKVKNLNIKDLELSTGKKTVIKGDFYLPDHRHMDGAFFNEYIKYAYIDLQDLENFNLPERTGIKHIELDPYLKKQQYAELKEVNIYGTNYLFYTKINALKTDLGDLCFKQAIKTEQKLDGFYFSPQTDTLKFAIINDFNLAKMIDEDKFGHTNGEARLNAKISNEGELTLEHIKGKLNAFSFNNYNYHPIYILDGKLENEVVYAKVNCDDINAQFKYEGEINYENEIHMDFTSDFTYVDLQKTHFIEDSNIVIQTKAVVDLESNFSNHFIGDISFYGSNLSKNDEILYVSRFDLYAEKENNYAVYNVKSDLFNLEFKGEINFKTLYQEVMNEYNTIIPGLYAYNRKNKVANDNKFEFNLQLFKPQNFLEVFYPSLEISPNTLIDGKFDAKQKTLTVDLISDYLYYDEAHFNHINLNQNINPNKSTTILNIQHLSYGDSLMVDSLNLDINGNQNLLNTKLSWNPNSKNNTFINWETTIDSKDNMTFKTFDSYITLKEIKYNIKKNANIQLNNDEINVDGFEITQNNQIIRANGKVSKRNEDKLNYEVISIDLLKLSSFLGLDQKIEGDLNGWGQISNPYTNFRMTSDAKIDNLKIDDQEIGNVTVLSDWDQTRKAVVMEGDLSYKGNQTFDFEGIYFPKKQTDNLSLYLTFNNTDLSVANAFVDEKVIDKIQGKINGKLEIKGSLEKPILIGELDLANAGAKLQMFGVSYYVSGKIISKGDAIELNNLPVQDEEGNTGSVVGTILHDNFTNWNFDLNFNLEDDYKSLLNGKKMPLKRFLALNTSYNEKEVYFGKGYVVGDVNLFGYADNLDITVNAKTKQGTVINIPLYGSKEIEEENNFIKFKSKDTTLIAYNDKIDLTGVNLKLNFDVTQETKLNVIFNDQTSDAIHVESGQGNISINLDNTGDVRMDGIYTIKKGTYHFVLNAYSQDLKIESGSSINWTGDPVHAKIDLKAYFPVNCLIEDISPSEDNNSNKNFKEVRSYVVLNDDLMKPTISFDIQAPSANETEKSLIARVNADKDEQNRQFFSLLIWRKFQPMKSAITANSNMALDLINGQINSLLADMSKDYRFNVNLNNDTEKGESSYEVGFQTGVLNDRLILSANVGVGNTTTNNQSKNNFIGDVSVEYLLNEDGTFRTQVFNKSNQNNNTNINKGPFTQGVGVSYQEDFNNVNDFKMIQFFLDLFRKPENKKMLYKKKNSKKPVPPETTKDPIILPKKEE